MLARGYSQAEAYEHAGYDPDSGNASRLANTPAIMERVAALQARAAAEFHITLPRLVADLYAIVDAAFATGTPAGLRVATFTLMQIARLAGLMPSTRSKPSPIAGVTGRLDRPAQPEPEEPVEPPGMDGPVKPAHDAAGAPPPRKLTQAEIGLKALALKRGVSMTAFDRLLASAGPA
jgi:hypothetical protein